MFIRWRPVSPWRSGVTWGQKARRSVGSCRSGGCRWGSRWSLRTAGGTNAHPCSWCCSYMTGKTGRGERWEERILKFDFMSTDEKKNGRTGKEKERKKISERRKGREKERIHDNNRERQRNSPLLGSVGQGLKSMEAVTHWGLGLDHVIGPLAAAAVLHGVPRLLIEHDTEEEDEGALRKSRGPRSEDFILQHQWLINCSAFASPEGKIRYN